MEKEASSCKQEDLYHLLMTAVFGVFLWSDLSTEGDIPEHLTTPRASLLVQVHAPLRAVGAVMNRGVRGSGWSQLCNREAHTELPRRIA
jgi:hypothetical protein